MKMIFICLLYLCVNKNSLQDDTLLQLFQIKKNNITKRHLYAKNGGGFLSGGVLGERVHGVGIRAMERGRLDVMRRGGEAMSP